MTSEHNPISVCTFNIRGWSEEHHDGANSWLNRSTFTTEILNKVLPDIVAFQEFSGDKNSEFYSKNLPGMTLHLGPQMDGDRYNPIAFRSDKLSIVSTKDIWLSSTDEPVPDWGADETRSANLVVFDYKPNEDIEKTRMIFVNTHLDNRHELAKIESTKKIIQELSKNPDNLPIIVVGDFNASSLGSRSSSFHDSKAHDFFVEAGFTNVFENVHPEFSNNPPHTFHRYEGEQFVSEVGNAHFDWILVKGFTPQLYEILRDSKDTAPHFPSDHYPIASKLKPQKETVQEDIFSVADLANV